MFAPERESLIENRSVKFNTRQLVLNDMMPQKKNGCSWGWILGFPFACIGIFIIIGVSFTIFFLIVFLQKEVFFVIRINESKELQRTIDPLNSTEKDQFLGGDGGNALLVEFFNSQYLFYLFGNTLIGKMTKYGERGDYHVIENSLGILDLNSMGHQALFWRSDNSTGEPLALFPCEDPSIVYYLTNGLIVSTGEESVNIYLFASRTLKPKTPFVRSPEVDGVKIIRCSVTASSVSDVNSWLPTCEYSDFPRKYAARENGFMWASVGSFVWDVQREWVYFFGTHINRYDESLISRMLISDFEAHRWDQLYFWTVGNEWRRGEIVGDNALELQALSGLPKSTALNLVWNSFLSQFILIEKRDMHHTLAYLFSSTSLTGPYSRYLLLETDFGEDVNAVAWNVIPELSPSDDQIVFTYDTVSYNNFEYYYRNLHSFFIPQFHTAVLGKRKKSVV